MSFGYQRASVGARVLGGCLCLCRSSTSLLAGYSRRPVARARRSLEGFRAAPSAPRAVGRAAAVAAAAAGGERPARIGRVEPGDTAVRGTRSSSRRDAAALAPKDRRAPLDVLAPTTGRPPIAQA